MLVCIYIIDTYQHLYVHSMYLRMYVMIVWITFQCMFDTCVYVTCVWRHTYITYRHKSTACPDSEGVQLPSFVGFRVIVVFRRLLWVRRPIAWLARWTSLCVLRFVAGASDSPSSTIGCDLSIKWPFHWLCFLYFYDLGSFVSNLFLLSWTTQQHSTDHQATTMVWTGPENSTTNWWNWKRLNQGARHQRS